MDETVDQAVHDRANFILELAHAFRRHRALSQPAPRGVLRRIGCDQHGHVAGDLAQNRLNLGRVLALDFEAAVAKILGVLQDFLN